MMKALEKRHNYKRWANENTQPFMTFAQSVCRVRFQGNDPKGSLVLKSSTFLTKIPSKDNENPVPTQAKDSDPKPGSSPSSTLSFDHFLSHYHWLNIYNMKTGKSTFEEEGFLCTLRHSRSQPRALLTSSEGWEPDFEALAQGLQCRVPNFENASFWGLWSELRSWVTIWKGW